MATTRIWDGTATFTSGSSTPFGMYDDDSEFQLEAPKQQNGVQREWDIL